MNLNCPAKCLFLFGAFLALLRVSPAQTPTPTSTNNFEIGVGLRRQMVAAGDTIIFVADKDYQKLNPVSVTFQGTSSPCGEGSPNVPSGVCTISGNATLSKPYRFCLSSDSSCLNNQTSTKGDVWVQTASSPPAPPSTVYIALTSEGQVNNLLPENDTINWLDKDGKPQGTKVTGISLLGPWAPCSGQSGAHQKGACKGHVSWPLKKISFNYDCDPNSCSDPVVHLIKPSGSPGFNWQDLIEWSLGGALHLLISSVMILAAAFGIIFFIRKR